MKNTMYRFAKSIQLRTRIIKNGSSNLKIVIGSGGVFQKGWIPTNMETIKIPLRNDWERYFKPDTIQIILAEHVWEHLTQEESDCSAKIVFDFLKIKGHFRVAVPDGFHPDPNYIRGVDVEKSPEKMNRPEAHKFLYNYKTLSNVFENAGFQVKLLEYYDEEGTFHFNDWDPSQGLIHRSKRFKNLRSDISILNMPNYTSLILDAIKV